MSALGSRGVVGSHDLSGDAVEASTQGLQLMLQLERKTILRAEQNKTAGQLQRCVETISKNKQQLLCYEVGGANVHTLLLTLPLRSNKLKP